MSTLLTATLPSVVRLVINTDAAVVVRQALDLLEKSTNQPIMTALEVRGGGGLRICWGTGGFAAAWLDSN